MNASLCPVCSSNRMRPRFTAAKDYITGDGFAVKQCETCGFGQTLPIPADLANYYPSQYRRYHPAIAGLLGALYQIRVKRWLKLFPRPGEILEIGCGNGLMLNLFQKQGWHVLGTERTEAAMRIAREQFGVDVITGGLDAVDPDRKFDLILLVQVLEHLDNPVVTIQTAAKKLTPNGRLIVGVPNFASWQANFGGPRWFHLDVPRHLGHYTQSSLDILMSQADLKIISKSFISPEHDPYGWIQSVLNRVDKKHNRLTKLLMRLENPNPLNLLHLAFGCIIGAVAVPLSLITWAAGQGAMIEIICAPDLSVQVARATS